MSGGANASSDIGFYNWSSQTSSSGVRIRSVGGFGETSDWAKIVGKTKLGLLREAAWELGLQA